MRAAVATSRAAFSLRSSRSTVCLRPDLPRVRCAPTSCCAYESLRTVAMSPLSKAFHMVPSTREKPPALGCAAAQSTRSRASSGAGAKKLPKRKDCVSRRFPEKNSGSKRGRSVAPFCKKLTNSRSPAAGPATPTSFRARHNSLMRCFDRSATSHCGSPSAIFAGMSRPSSCVSNPRLRAIRRLSSLLYTGVLGRRRPGRIVGSRSASSAMSSYSTRSEVSVASRI
mmetsp:Transcript_2258/g.9756  ORF Transcript_2258/g.9756 Transcript_2258/m.9756 type:complete len:226 (+) Transcript_2258:537-1214(+)